MKFPVLWSGITHSVLGAPVNSTCYIKKVVNCAIKQSGKSPIKCSKAHLNISTYKMRYINALTLTIKNKDDLATPANDDEDRHENDNDDDCDDDDIK